VGLSEVLILVIAVAGFVAGYLAAVLRHGDTKVGTPSASHNSVRNAIAQVRELARRTLCKPPKYNEFVAYLDWLEQQHP